MQRLQQSQIELENPYKSSIGNKNTYREGKAGIVFQLGSCFSFSWDALFKMSTTRFGIPRWERLRLEKRDFVTNTWVFCGATAL